jgi:hypothetical protein
VVVRPVHCCPALEEPCIWVVKGARGELEDFLFVSPLFYTKMNETHFPIFSSKSQPENLIYWEISVLELTPVGEYYSDLYQHLCQAAP